MMNNETNKLIGKILLILVPFLIGFFTWVVVAIFEIDGNLKVIQNDITTSSITNDKIYVAATETRNLSFENNIILNQKAEKVDVENINKRLEVIETKLNKFTKGSIYSYYPISDSNITYLKHYDSSLYGFNFYVQKFNR